METSFTVGEVDSETHLWSYVIMSVIFQSGKLTNNEGPKVHGKKGLVSKVDQELNLKGYGEVRPLMQVE